MLGAIAGDIIGSVYEFDNIKTKDFPLFREDSVFTDDTVLTVALADSILSGRPYVDLLHEYYHRYPDVSYGGRFRAWAESGSREPYNSFGNGAAMRVSPVGWACDDLDTVLLEAERAAAVTHDHPEGIKGAQATAAAIFLARTGSSKQDIQSWIEQRFGYDLSTPLDQIRPHYRFDETCQGTVPQAIRAFLESEDYEDAVRNAISLGGDSDTLACITGGIAEACFTVPRTVEAVVSRLLGDELARVVRGFEARYISSALQGGLS
ncbi:ADP-ribosylglycohydrolase family protein [Alkalilimnicola sp. S0819]|uniref:ADP-ribosylglycohydrolase family protein n=1 Tax=Alkalilimnicola sp. S0819 TaxID=2613922 RepID=UPI0012615E64|nr:ADP-ribosylglycohydrolase family protein [Alkalilimnicola sp. S0819]KAB7624101.1 ADP-ribosylglycohydrolase family protein [Alkalilimnicola sp. S0819]MPQ16352.1 ADP-ribosylglycohydrolase family protein [Alkalilimnicola sp. S0819]